MFKALRNENGIALVIAISFLLVLSILVTVLHGSSLYEMYSSKKYQDSQMAFYSAESAVRMALRWLEKNGATTPPEDGTTPSWFNKTGTVYAEVPDSNSSTNSDKWNLPAGQTGSFVYRYYIECLKTEGKVHYYRITAEGSNLSGSIKKQIQMVTTAEY